MSQATLHLVSGLPCSGKTTYSRKLAQSEVGSTLFCLDQWLISLFTRYSIRDVGRDEHVRRVLACRELMWESAGPLLKLGASVIFDDGFFYREHRMLAIRRAQDHGARSVIHHISLPVTEIKERLNTRNAKLPEFNFFIEGSMVDDFAKLYQVPAEDEGAAVVRVTP